MRVIDAVVARRAAGLPVIDMSAGQPSTPAPAAVRAAAVEAIGPPTDRLHERTRHSATARSDRRALPACRMASTSIRRRWRSRPARPAASATRSSAAFDPGDTVAVARPGYPAYRNMLTALGCRVLELPCGAATRFQPTVAQLDALPRATGRARRRQPRQPDRNDGGRRGAAGADRVVRRARHPVDQRRDLPRHHLRRRCCERMAHQPRADRGEHVLEVLLDDRLAHRLAARARTNCSIPSTGWPATSRSARRRCRNWPPWRPSTPTTNSTPTSRGTRPTAPWCSTRCPRIGLDRLAPADGAFYVYADVSRWTHDSLSFVARAARRVRGRDRAGRGLRPGRRGPVRPDVLRRRRRGDRMRDRMARGLAVRAAQVAVGLSHPDPLVSAAGRGRARPRSAPRARRRR